MQTELGSPLIGETVPVHYAYIARYTYSDVVAQSDNFLRLSAYSDTYQKPGAGEVATTPPGRQIVYPDAWATPSTGFAYPRRTRS